MTEQQYEREKRLELRANREVELRRLARARLTADPRYVQNAVDFIWERLLDRKLGRGSDSLRPVDRKRLDTLAGLYA
jgi:hypothetical protein